MQTETLVASPVSKQPAQRLRNTPRAMLVAALALAACVPAPSVSTDGSKKPAGWGSAPVAAGDNPDMTPPVPVSPAEPSGPSSGQLGCHGYGACYGLCNSNATTQADYDSCSAACDQAASAAATSAFNATFACGVNACRSSGACVSSTDGSDACFLCAYDAVSAMFGLPCGGDPMCNASACTAQVNACLSSLP